MAKRGYKLQEFLAHPTNVNCLSIGKKTSRLLITGGDDHKVNLWAIGKPASLMSLRGHTSPVESVAFDSAEVSVVAGGSTGVINHWDLEEAKMVRALTGHRSNCTTVEFHPFGDFFASGSKDTNLKVWDIRKKGCIHTYRGHTRDINTIKFTPDGRWIVSGGLDNVVKVWDLTAGKILHEFKLHEGHIRSLDFHPLEFLLATGSADGTVKFWDLESFELIGSSRPESSGVRAMTFHPDGRTLFCGLDDNLKVYSWEPVICHDSVDMGWSTLGDLCINEGKLLGCSYYASSVAVWVSDISLIEPYGADMTDKHEYTVEKSTSSDCRSFERMGNGTRLPSILRSASPECETNEIKNIYIDRGNLTAAQKTVLPLDSEKVKNVTSEKQNASSRKEVESFIIPDIVPHDGNIGEDSSDSGSEPITFSRTKPGMLLRPAHVRKTPTKFDGSKQSPAVQSGTRSHRKGGSDSEKEQDSPSGYSVGDRGRKPCDEEHTTIKSITDKFEKALSLEPPSSTINCLLPKPPHASSTPDTESREATRSISVDSESMSKRKGAGYLSDQDLKVEIISEDRARKPCEESVMNITGSKSELERSPTTKAPDAVPECVEPLNRSSKPDSVKVVRGVAVVSGRTRSLVERFERREQISINENKLVTVPVNQSPEATVIESDVSSPQPANTIPTQVMPMMIEKVTEMRKPERFTGIGNKVISMTTNQAANVITDESQASPPQPGNTVLSPGMPVTVDQKTDVEDHKRYTGGGDKTVSVATDHLSNVITDESQASPPQPGNTVSSPVMSVIVDQATDVRDHKRYTGSGDKTVSVVTDHPTIVIPDESQKLSPQPGKTVPSGLIPVTADQSAVVRKPKRLTGNGVRTISKTKNQPTNAIKEESHVLPLQRGKPVRSQVMRVRGNQATDMRKQKRFSSNGFNTVVLATDRPTKVMTDESPVPPPQPENPVPNRVKPVMVNTRKQERFNGNGDKTCNETINQPTNMITDEPIVVPSRPVDNIPTQKEEPEISGRVSETDITEILIQTHDAFLSTLQSRLMKLQIVRHFWERKDIKGAIDALKKLPDHSVQADVVTVLMENTKILTLDVFSSLLPILTDLLGSKTERPANVSLEMLLKLVAVFGTVIHSTVSAPRVVGVDLHAEERLQLCNECFVELENVKKILPELTRKGGLIARKAQELNLVFQGP